LKWHVVSGLFSKEKEKEKENAVGQSGCHLTRGLRHVRTLFYAQNTDGQRDKTDWSSARRSPSPKRLIHKVLL
jgi:hypothetical protein